MFNSFVLYDDTSLELCHQLLLFCLLFRSV